MSDLRARVIDDQEKDSEPFTLDLICQELGFDAQFLLNLAKDAEQLYYSFAVQKRDGGWRCINSPIDKLKRVQRHILDHLLYSLEMPDYLHGAIKNRSIISNASAHVGRPIVLSFDLRNCYDSISAQSVRAVFRHRLNCDTLCAEVLTRLCTHAGTLPQGAPSSACLANLVLQDLDRELLNYAGRNWRPDEFSYTRYLDDITISGNAELSNHLGQFAEIVRDCGFELSSAKTRVMRHYKRQYVTGIVVNRKANIPRKKIRELRQQIYFCEKFGLEKHCEITEQSPQAFLRRIRGLIAYVGMLKPELVVRANFVLSKFSEQQRSSPDPMFDYLCNIIDERMLAVFKIEQTTYTVVPLEIDVNDDGYMSLRCFTLEPAQGYENFLLSDINSLSSKPAS